MQNIDAKYVHCSGYVIKSKENVGRLSATCQLVVSHLICGSKAKYSVRKNCGKNKHGKRLVLLKETCLKWQYCNIYA
jgi:hypothetical protein